MQILAYTDRTRPQRRIRAEWILGGEVCSIISRVAVGVVLRAPQAATQALAVYCELGSIPATMAYSTSLAFDSAVVIESLPSGELRSGRDLFETTIAPVSVADPGFVSELYEANSKKEFLGALNAVRATAQQYGRSPIVHIEVHGNQDGIGLANRESVTWSEIAPLLTAVNQLSRMNLLVVAAMCQGWHMSSVLRPTDRAPAFGIIGTVDKIPVGELLRAMQAFYRVLLEPEHDLRAALDEANAAQSSQHWRFRMVGAELLLCRVFAHYVKSIGIEETQTQRVSRIVADLARSQGLDVSQTMQLRHEIARIIDDHAAWFALYRARFLMLDLFPKNAPRFPLRYEDCHEDAA